MVLRLAFQDSGARLKEQSGLEIFVDGLGLQFSP